MEQRVLALENEVTDLREEIELLRGVVDRLKKQLRHFEEGGGSQRVSLAAGGESSAGGSSVRSLGGYTLVAGVGETGQLVAPQGSGTESGAAGGRGLTWTEREEICFRIGVWIQRNLAGDHRGSSGRDLLPYQSRLWLVARSYQGEVFSPLRVYRSFTRCREVVKRGSDVGDSVFVGVPSEREARKVAEGSGLGFPDRY